jgi:Protein of unknown function (DUF4199)
MKTNLILILKNAWPYGLIMAGISVVISVLLYIINVNMFTITFAVLSLLIFVIGIPVTMSILGCNNLRLQHANERQISYLDAVVSCMVILMIGFLISNLYSYIFNNFIDPEYMKQQISKMADMLQKYNLPQDKIDETMAKTANRMNIGPMLLNSLIFSVVISLIVALFIRKKDKLDEKVI